MKKYYDAVIVGCGVAGCFAALHLPQEADILMITKADTEDSDSFLAQGGICVLKNESDYDAFYEDTMHAGHYENTPESVDIMIRSSRNVINQLIAWGVDFRRDENGELCYTKEGAHSTNRILFHDDVTGKEITSKLLAQVKKLPNVTLLALMVGKGLRITGFIDPLNSMYADREYDLFQFNNLTGKRFFLCDTYLKKYGASEKAEQKLAFYALWNEVYCFIKAGTLIPFIMNPLVKNMNAVLGRGV